MRKFLAICTLIVLCAACSMPETRIYSLALPAEKKVSERRSGSSVNIQVSAPRHLSQQYMAFRTSPYQLEISKYSKWDAPPDESLRDAFRDRLSARGVFREVRTLNFVPAGFYSTVIKLRRFERSDEDKESFGELDFDVTLSSPEGGEIYRNTVSRKIKLPARDNLELAKSLSSALSEGVDEAVKGIAAALEHH
jgi:ABC-type uncharacterized transport system auxiliary subunit